MRESNKLKAFSLIELSVALLIIGIIISSIFKGAQLVESAKIQSVAKQFQEIRLNVENYVTRYGELPGKSSLYNTLEDTKNALQNLCEKGIVSSENYIRSKFGGIFKLKTIGGKHYIQLVTDREESLLSEKQVEVLKNFVGSDFTIMDGGIFSYPVME